MARRAFGVPITEAHTADGSRVLAVGHDGRSSAQDRR
jgi:hypothetical protein